MFYMNVEQKYAIYKQFVDEVYNKHYVLHDSFIPFVESLTLVFMLY